MDNIEIRRFYSGHLRSADRLGRLDETGLGLQVGYKLVKGRAPV